MPVRKVLFWTIVAATLAVYLVMLLWSLPKITAAAGGRVPFDLHPLGYSEADARAFLAALGTDGRRFYVNVQHLLDLAYPALLALALALAFRRLMAPGWPRAVLTLSAVAGMVSDYVENWLVGRMLAVPAADVPAALIDRASTATLLKSLCTSLALTGLVIALAGGLLRWKQRVTD